MYRAHWHKHLAVCIIALSCAVLCSACAKKGPVTDKPQVKKYIVMEKVLADAPGRPRTTLKVVIPEGSGREQVQKALEFALATVRKDDPALKAVIIWSYRTRSELNGSNYTLGKLEWSADGRDFAGKTALTPNPKLDIAAP